MAKFYLLGGENIRRQDAKPVNEAAFADAGEKPSVLVFSWARASFDRNYLRQKRLWDYFRGLGAGEINAVDYSEGIEDIERKLSEANLVYLTGGQPSVLIERLNRSGVDKLLKKYKGTVVGRSAGALVLCNRCVVTLRDSKKMRLIDGFGLVDLTLKAHYKRVNDEALLRFSLQERVYAVPKGSAIVANGDGLSFLGKIYLFENGEKVRLN
ncbi:MAG: Type 1 glutamine amidotransferase-like domain-containing protein [Candidatus Bathyarchaeota archaeon]|nr:Type 1 glutamine amidotransferase-like domain-containing protein [Candidatus Bathyarchaeota archaeon]